MPHNQFYRTVVLHRRQYKASTYLLKLWVEDFGKVSAIVRKHSKKPDLCHPFSLLDIRLKLAKSNDSLSVVQAVEQVFYFRCSSDLAQLSQLYINELLYWLLPFDHVDKALFMEYLATMEALVDNKIKLPLRYFELELLKSLGYGFQCDVDAENDPIDPQKFYQMTPLSSFYRVYDSSAIKGEIIQKINRPIELWETQMHRTIYKLIRMNLNACLQGRQLKTRELLRSYINCKARTKTEMKDS